MKTIYIESEIYACCPRTIFYTGGKQAKTVLTRHSKELCSLLTRNNVHGYRFCISTPQPAWLQKEEEIILRNNPTLGNTENRHLSDISKNILAGIIDVETNCYGIPSVEILLEELPENSDENEIYERTIAFLNKIILIEKEYSKYNTDNNKKTHYKETGFTVTEEERNECQEFIAADLLSDAIYQNNDKCISRLCIDNSFDIHLPKYPQIKIELAPLPKALYILLLLHPEGFVLKEIHDYSNELQKIYRIISGRQNPTVIKKMFDSITDPTINPLHKNLSIIRRAFLSKLRTDIAEHYIPTQGRHCKHRIPLESTNIELPELFLQS